VPGLSCRNRFAAPDFLRGENTDSRPLSFWPTLAPADAAVVSSWDTHEMGLCWKNGAVSEFLTRHG